MDLNQEVFVKLKLADLNVVLQALGKLPFEQVVQLISDIRNQVDPQVMSPPVTPAPTTGAANA
jgi:hypothetical protein